MNANLQSWPAQRTSTKTLVSIVLAAWFVFALVGSLAGLFQSEQRPPAALGAMALGPVIVFAIALARWGEFRRLVLSVNPRLLTALQTWRVVGLTFVVLYWRGLLPGVFALPAGWGDVAIGLTALPVAWAMGSPAPSRRPIFAIWNLLGILDLVVAVTLGVLSSDTPIGILAGETNTRLMGSFPLSLIPTFFVPLFLIFHLVVLAQLRGAACGRSGRNCSPAGHAQKPAKDDRPAQTASV